MKNERNFSDEKAIFQKVDMAGALALVLAPDFLDIGKKDSIIDMKFFNRRCNYGLRKRVFEEAR